MIVKLSSYHYSAVCVFESSVNSYDSQTSENLSVEILSFESSVNSYDSQTSEDCIKYALMFESSVNSYDSQTLLYQI